MVIVLLISYFPVAISAAFIDVLSSALARWLSPRLGNGLAFLTAWFATSAFCFALGMGAFFGLVVLMGEDDFGPYEDLSVSLTALVSILAPPAWLSYQRDAVFVRQGSWRLPPSARRIAGFFSLAALVVLTLNLTLSYDSLDDVDWLRQFPLFASAIGIGLYVLSHKDGVAAEKE